MAKRKRNKKKETISIIVTLIVIVAIVGGFLFYRYVLQSPHKPQEDPPIELPTDLGEANVAKAVSWNTELNIPENSVFYQSDKDDILSYYSTIDFKEATNEETKENFFADLQVLLSVNFTKLNYNGKNSNSKYPGTNFTWANYVIADRDFSASPLTQEEVDRGGWDKDVTLDILYRTENVVFESSLGSKGLLDREHILPKSYGFNFSDDDEAYQKLDAGCDLHNLRSADGEGNRTGHNNRLYDDLDEGTAGVEKVYDPDEKSYSLFNENYFEPQDEDKGEIARAVFYMAVKYHNYEEGENGLTEGPAIKLTDDAIRIPSTVEPSETKVNPAEFGVLSTLLEWNQLDPVSENEMIRNNIVHHLQGNRNPFVDYPNLANILFAK